VVILQTEPIDLASLFEQVRGDGDGAVVHFVGYVRNHHKGREVRYLEYHGYDEMAEAEMRRLADSIRTEFEIDAIAIVHRLGRLEIGDASVAVVISSAHRRPAFDACREAMDRLKRTVPIWKKEFFVDGVEWVDGRDPC